MITCQSCDYIIIPAQVVKMVDAYTFCCFLFYICFLNPSLCRMIEVLDKNKDELTKYAQADPSCFPEPDVCRNVSQLITSKGYPCEEHIVQTKDGFLLGVQRIPCSRNCQHLSPNPRPVIFLMHGLLSSSADWVNNLANESFAYLLADSGFDVWLGNARGNTYSRQHTKYKPSQAAFWAFSWDEMAKYDLPAMINYILSQTGQEQLYYVGHSQGTMIAFAHFSQDQELAKKVKTVFALGPVATVGHIKSPLWTLAYLTPEIKDLFYIFGINEFLPKSEIIKILGQTVCVDSWTRIACQNIIFLLAGFDAAQLNKTRIPVYVANTPAGTSVQNIIHFAQMVRSGKFQMYDYGSKEKNLEHYGQDGPPVYDPTKVKVPIYLISGQKDWLADPKDVEFLRNSLPNIVTKAEIPDWDHLDFLWAMDAATLVYRPIIKVITHKENMN